MVIKVKVTKEVIKKSRFCGETVYPTVKNCAVALALKDLFPEVSVGSSIISAFRHTSRTIGLPDEVQAFIMKFDELDSDSRLHLAPISFEIKISSRIINEVGISKVYKVLSESRTLELVRI